MPAELHALPPARVDAPVESTCRVVANERVNADYLHLVLEAEPALLRVQPGQFFHLLCPVVDDDAPFLRRPMSIYRVARERGQLEFLYKVVGSGTRTLATLAPGDWLEVMGPLGQGFRLDAGLRHLVMVARGVGLSTLAPLAAWAGEHGVGVTAILSARSRDVVMSVNYLEGTGAAVTCVTDEEGSSDPENVASLVRTAVAEHGAGLIATCGSNRLMKRLQALADELGVPGQVALEQHMACGIGSCFCCVRTFRERESGRLEYRKVCQAGPVFDLQEAVSW